MLDDGLSILYRLDDLCPQAGAATQTKRSQVGAATNDAAERRWVRSAATFKEGMLAVQVQQAAHRPDAVGFLRDAGHAVCKKNRWLSNNLSIYKIVLLDVEKLKEHNVEYQPHLQKLEDVCFTAQILDNGGSTLKCQLYTEDIVIEF